MADFLNGIWRGFLRPFQLLTLLSDQPLARRAWLLTVGVQAALTLSIGSVMFVRDLENERTEETRAEEKARRVKSLEGLRHKMAALRDAGAEAELNHAVEKFAKREANDRATAAAVAALLGGHDGGIVDVVKAVTAAAEDEDPDAEAPPPDVDPANTEAAVNAAVLAALNGGEDDDGDEDKPAHPKGFWSVWNQRLALWASSLVIVQTVVLALTRDHQDRLARDLSLLIHVQPEDTPGAPRLRLDWKWLGRKLRRRVRGALVLAAGVATMLPVLLVATIFHFKDFAVSAVVGLVSAYWWVVFTAARSARAWRTEADLTPPTPLRVLATTVERFPWLRWFGFGVLVRFAIWASKSMAAPARSIEADLPRFIGLGLARVIATIPVVRIGLRAAIIVAAEEALEASASDELLAPDDATVAAPMVAPPGAVPSA